MIRVTELSIETWAEGPTLDSPGQRPGWWCARHFYKRPKGPQPRSATVRPQSLANVLIHLVFSTKDRRPFLRKRELRDVMTGYLIGTLENLKCPSLQVGVVEDHVHILCQLHRTMAISKLVEELKTSSSVRIKEESSDLRDFHWQNGYGAFSVSQSNSPQVKSYIANQEEHHRRMTFQDEYRAMLERHGIEFDERYVWD